MNNKTINILGTKYKIEYRKSSDDIKLETCDGYCDTSIKLIVIAIINKSDNSVNDLNSYNRKVLRHEIMHAILYESGLGCSSWADNEEIIDWMAIQYPKLKEIFDKLDI